MPGSFPRRPLTSFALFSLGATCGLALAGGATLAVQANLARKAIGQPFGEDAPRVDGEYGSGPGHPITIGALGDSTAAGLGADHPHQTATAVLATGVSALAGRPVRLVSVAKVGAESNQLHAQVDELLTKAPALDVAVIMIGANDVTHLQKVSDSTGILALAVRRLRATGAEVVVGTCPDLGSIRPIHQPLRSVVRALSRRYAAAQTVAVVEAGGRTVSIGDILGPEFDSSPGDLFSRDRFHPSAAGYARCGSALLPAVCSAARIWPEGVEPKPEPRRGDRYAPVAHAAADAALHPGTEVYGTVVHGRERGLAGRWAQLRRRSKNTDLTAEQPTSHA